MSPLFYVCKNGQVKKILAGQIKRAWVVRSIDILQITLTSFNIISELIWYRIDRGFTIFDWESGEHYVSLLGYLTVFYLTYWLVFVRGSLVSQTKL